MRLGRSSRLRSVPKNTGTTAQSLAGAALGLAGGAGTGATERVARRAAPSPPLVMASLLASTLGGIGGGAGAPTGAGGGDAAGGGGGDGAPGTGSAGATDRFMAKVLRLPSAPVGSVGGAEAIFGEGAIGRTVGADPTRGGVSLAKVDRL